ISLLRDVAGVGRQRQWKAQRHLKRALAKILPATGLEPIATLVVPVLADPAGAKATIASCLAQTVADRTEILVIETDRARVASWRDGGPQVRVIVSPMAPTCV